jgi:2-desacetyl-2-hydroxyethyl bacteriochlorophyllide A dehydrogenase
VVFAAQGKAAVEEVPVPDLRPTDVRVEVEYSSVSIGTERWCLMGRLHAPAEAPSPFPFVPGYQAAGVITEVGRDVRRLKPGDRAFSVCGRLAEGGPRLMWGGHMQCHVTPWQNVFKLPASVSTRAASGLLLAQVGYNGAVQPRVRKGDVVVVIGDGLVGQYAGQVFRHRGAHVILSGHHDARLRLAARYAADEVVNSAREDFASHVRRKWPDGVQVAAESASRNELVRMAIDMLEYNGQLVLLGYYPEGECMIDIHWVRARETTIYCPNSWTPERLKATLKLIEQGHMKVDELVTHELPFTEAPRAYQMILDRSEEFLGVVFRWSEA